jgi:hypothetical protein
MADFVATNYITLLFVNATVPGQLSWLFETNNVTTAGVVTDVGNDGILTQGVDTFISGSTYTGFYVDVDGQFFGIFRHGPTGTYYIPYDREQMNLGHGIPILPAIVARTTTLFDATLENAANCFLTGTHIATPGGERPIETLQPGDLVLTADGTATPVLWVWQQKITNIFGLGEARTPVRVAAGALGAGCPSRDLIVTADHALVVDGMLINAGALVNGTTIRFEPLSRMPAEFTYWHIETEAHAVLMAENCPAESFVDYTPREGFDNHAAYLERYGQDRLIEEMPMIRISTPRLLPPDLRARLGISRAA